MYSCLVIYNKYVKYTGFCLAFQIIFIIFRYKIKVMKKILIVSLLLGSLTSCKAQKEPGLIMCEQSLIDRKIYEDTIRIEFVGIDSLIFKGKNYRHVADSLFFLPSDAYVRRDIRNIKTGEIHRIVYERKKYDYINKPYDIKIYEPK